MRSSSSPSPLKSGRDLRRRSRWSLRRRYGIGTERFAAGLASDTIDFLAPSSLAFRVLGPLEIVADGRPLPLKAAKQKTILALLLLHRDEVVSVDRLQEALWVERPPTTATTALQGYISQLRRLLEGGKEGGAALLQTQSPGYLLAAAPEQLDLSRFEQLAESGREALIAGEPARAAALLAEALALWRGPPLADFAYEGWAQTAIGRLEELRLSALEDRIEADLACGRHGELVGELESLIAEQPLRERLRGQLMLALYRAGRQADALEAYQAARRALVEELGIEPSPELQRLNHSILNQDEALAAPARTASSRGPIVLPVPPSPLIGRVRELQELAERLSVANVRLLTLTGPGGTGKTRLALQVAADAADAYPDGIWWVPLAPLSDPALVLPTAGAVLGVRGELRQEIVDKRLLLLLDNFEHLIDAARDVGQLVAACPQLTVLVTSRERLQVAGEHEYALPAMAPSDGFELFAARALALGTEVDDEAGRELCERLEHLPLALELAAARTKVFSPAQLLERLGRRLDLFKGGRDADPRQRTLRATIEWSYDLLSPEQQQLFARLSVFAGGFTYEAAEAVCGADEDTLQSLLDKSLLRGLHGPTGEKRYWMLETIREYAFERLVEFYGAAEVRTAHLRHFVERAETSRRTVWAGGSVADHLGRLDAEVGNIRAAASWALEKQDGDALLRLVAATWRFFSLRGYLAEGRGMVEDCLELDTGEKSELRAYVAAGGTSIALSQGDLDDAQHFAEESLRLYEKYGDARRHSGALRDLGAVHWLQGDGARALAFASEALRLARSTADPEWVTPALALAGQIELDAGSLDRAAALLDEACMLAAEELPNEEWQADTQGASGYLFLARGDDASAERAFSEALALAERLGSVENVASCLYGLAAVAARSGDAGRSAEVLEEAERVRAESGLYVGPLERRALSEAQSAVGQATPAATDSR
jgi:predicted ATPase/DNA-binding SARP family transcriptional activator